MAGFLAATLLASGQPEGSEAAASKSADIVNPSGYPIVNEPITMSIVVPRPPGGSDPEQKWFWRYMERTTNIRMEVRQLQSANMAEQLNLIFATGELPDLFLGTQMANEMVMERALAEKAFLPLNDHIAKYAPDISRAWATYPDLKRSVTAPDGNVYGLAQLFNADRLSAPRFFVNTVWLERLGLKRPETLDEFYNTLVAMKTMDPNENGKADEIPYGGSWSQSWHEGIPILTALGFSTMNSISMGLKDGKAYFIPNHPLFKDYLSYMNKLWENELLDPDMFTQNQVQARAKSAQGIYGFLFEGAPFLIQANWLADEGQNPLSASPGARKVWPKYSPVSQQSFFVSTLCSYPEAAIRWANWFYHDEAEALFIGPAVGSKEAELGDLKYGYKVTEGGDQEFVYPPDKENWWNTIISYVSPWVFIGVRDFYQRNVHMNRLWDLRIDDGIPAVIGTYEAEHETRGVLARLSAADRGLVDTYYEKTEKGYKLTNPVLTEAQRSELGKMLDANEMRYKGSDNVQKFTFDRSGWWRSSIVRYNDPFVTETFPKVFIPSDKLERLRSLEVPITDYVRQMEARFITGAEPLENFGHYIDQLGKLGVAEYENIYQKAYESYLK